MLYKKSISQRDAYDVWETLVEYPVSNEDIVKTRIRIWEKLLICVACIRQRQRSLILHVFLWIFIVKDWFLWSVSCESIRWIDWLASSLSMLSKLLFGKILSNLHFRWFSSICTHWTLHSISGTESSHRVRFLSFPLNHRRPLTDWTTHSWLMFIAFEEKPMNDPFTSTVVYFSTFYKPAKFLSSSCPIIEQNSLINTGQQKRTSLVMVRFWRDARITA